MVRHSDGRQTGVMKYFETGQIIAAPYFSEELKRHCLGTGGKRILYPARVVVGNRGRGDLICKFLDNLPEHLVLVSSPSEKCFSVSEKIPKTCALCDGFQELVHREGEKVGKTALERWRIRKAAKGRALLKADFKPDCDGESVKAKWSQKCAVTGERIEPGDTITKTPGGWALSLPTPPSSPVVPRRRSERIASKNVLPLSNS